MLQEQQNLSVNIHQLLERFKSKKEFYRFLQLDCKAFLPKIGAVNIYFFKQILQAKKDYLKRDQVKVSSTPHIEGLTVQDFLNYARQRPVIMRYLPDERDWVHLDRQWISDVIYSIDTENFEQYIKNAISKRQEKFEEQQNMRLKCDQNLLRLFNNAKPLVDSSKRKRKRDEIEEVKLEEENLKTDKQEYLREHKRLKVENQELEMQIQLLNNTQEILNQLIDQGIINEEGDVLARSQFNI